MKINEYRDYIRSECFVCDYSIRKISDRCVSFVEYSPKRFRWINGTPCASRAVLKEMPIDMFDEYMQKRCGVTDPENTVTSFMEDMPIIEVVGELYEWGM